MELTRTQAAKLQKFIIEWLQPLIPTLQNLRIDGRTGVVSARDHLAWRDVGTVFDFLPLARSLGRV